MSEFVDATQNSTGYYWSKIITGLASEFDNINVICPMSSYGAITEPAPAVTYHPIKGHRFNKNKIVSRLLGQIIHAWQFSWALISKVKRGDVVFSGTNPAVLLFFAARLKGILGFKWLLLVHDVFPENLVPATVLRKEGLLYRILRAIFDNAYSRADMLIAIGRDMQETLSKKTDASAKIVYIANWVDPEDVIPLPRESSGLFAGKNWKDKTIFQFFGNLGRVQGLDDLLQALPHVKSHKAAFIFIGNGAQQDRVSEFIDRHPLLSVMRVPQLPFADNQIGLSACDVAIVLLAQGMKGLAVPSKAYFSLAADRPLLVVTEENSELHRLVQETDAVGWFCGSGDPIRLARSIDAICEGGLAAFSAHPRLVAIERFSYRNAISLYTKCIRELGIEPALRKA